MFAFFKRKTAENPQALTGALLVLLILLVGIQMVQFYKFRHRVQFVDQLEANNTQVIEELGLAQEYMTEFGTDLNQIRSFLLLPTKEYDFGKGAGEGEAMEEEDMNTLVFDFIGELGKYEQNKALYERNVVSIREWVTAQDWPALGLKVRDPQGLDLEEGKEFLIIGTEDETPLLRFILGYDGRFSGTSYDGSFSLEKTESFEKLEEEWAAYQGLENLKSHVKAVTDAKLWVETQLLPTESLTILLQEKGLRTTLTAQENDLYFYYSFQNSDLNALAELRLFKSDASLHLFTFGTEPKEQSLTQDNAMQTLEAAFKDLDTRTEGKKRFEANKKELMSIFEDKAFELLLENAGLSIGESYETTDRVYYPILNVQGNELRAFELDKNTGELKVKEKEDEAQTLSLAIQELQSDSKKKTLHCPGPCLTILV